MINYYNQDIEFELFHEEQISSWIKDTFHAEGITKEIELNIIFNSDEALLEINKQFLNHDFYTDIITFPLDETDEELTAELYISIDRIRDNAESLEVSFETELHRVIIHGVLHLCGFGDKTEKEEQEMRNRENIYLKKLVY